VHRRKRLADLGDLARQEGQHHAQRQTDGGDDELLTVKFFIWRTSFF
jgi:hypothetical protein